MLLFAGCDFVLLLVSMAFVELGTSESGVDWGVIEEIDCYRLY
jgi:hypothetical protein